MANTDSLLSLATKELSISKVKGNVGLPSLDILSVEEPLEIRIIYGANSNIIEKNISVTMRTPGDDLELAVGFLFTEGIILSYENVRAVYHHDKPCANQKQNVVIVELSEGIEPRLMQTDRNFYTTSSCGVCGKSSIQSIKTVNPYLNIKKTNLKLSSSLLYGLAESLRQSQGGFSMTGGAHASGLFDLKGKLIALKEDVGRHNALDKLIGEALKASLLPLQQSIVLLSGRASFELIQKAAMAGIPIVVALGAPSTLAVELANELDIALIGFLKTDRYNIYNLPDNIQIDSQI